MYTLNGTYGVRGMLFSLCIALGLALTGAQAQQNVVLIVVDALREDCVDDARGGLPLMPYVSSFPGTRFRNASSSSSWTIASMASIFTGTHVDTHQIHPGVQGLPESAENIAEYFKSAGYATLGVQTNGNLTAAWGFSQGFDQYLYSADAHADWVTTMALTLVQQESEPFFLYLHYNQPHVPYYPPVSYRTMMGHPNPALGSGERYIVENFTPYLLDYLKFHLGMQPSLTYEQLSPLGEDAARALYDGEVRFSDDQIEILLNSILANHPDSIVIITADHGEHFWEHNALGHVTTVYQELVHVPLFIGGPETPETSVDTVVSLVDLLPTMANMLGLPHRDHWEGLDLFGPRNPNGPVYANTKAPAPFLLDVQMIRLGDMKLIRNYKTGDVELFNLALDPGEINNLADAQPEMAQALIALLHKHLLKNARANGWDSIMGVSPGSMAVEGGAVRLTAAAGTGHVWFKNGVPLSDAGSGIEGSNTQVLTIRDLVAGDAGSYECFYSDEKLQLNVTRPYALHVLTPEAVPAYSMPMVLLLTGLLLGVAVSCLRKTQTGRDTALHD